MLFVVNGFMGAGLITINLKIMKLAEEYFTDFCLPSNESLRECKFDVCLLIKRAQIEAIEETVRRCADNAQLIHLGYDDYEVDAKSILLVGDKLKQELNLNNNV